MQSLTYSLYCMVYRHNMMTSSNGNIFELLATCAVTGEFPAQRLATRSFDAWLICTWINGRVNNDEAGGLRRNRTHYDVTVMDGNRTAVIY